MDERIVFSGSLIKKSEESARKMAAIKQEKRKLRPKKKRKVSDVFALLKVYKFLYDEEFLKSPCVWGSRELGQCRNLIKKLGDVDRTERLIRYVFKNWEWISREVNLSGAPMIGDILGRCLRYEERAGIGEGKKERDGWVGVARL